MTQDFANPSGRTAAMQDFCSYVHQRIPDGYGCAVLVFEYGDGEDGAYVSTCGREDMIKALRELADTLEQRRDFPHQGRN